jgi:elongation factor P
MQAKDIKTGTIVVYEDAPVVIEKISVQSPSARGASTLYKFRGRNLVTKQKTDISLKGNDSLDEADFQKRGVSLMYADATHMHFLDQLDFQQYSIELSTIEDQRWYIKDGLEGMVALIYNDEFVGVELPAAVTLEITQCDPSVRGNSATSRLKPATLETGLVIQVPEYLKQGESIRVDTRSGEFLSRA